MKRRKCSTPPIGHWAKILCDGCRPDRPLKHYLKISPGEFNLCIQSEVRDEIFAVLSSNR